MSDAGDFDPYGYSPYDPQYEHHNGVSAHGASDDGWSSDDSGRGHHDRSHGHRSTAGGRSSRHRYDDYSGYSQRPSIRSRRSGIGNTKSSRSNRGHRRKEEEQKKEDDGWDTDYDPRDKYYLSGDDGHHGYQSPPPKDRYKPRNLDSDDRHDRNDKSRRSGKQSSRDKPPRRPDTLRRESSDRIHRRPAARPKAMTRYSSYNARPRSKYPPSSSRGKPAPSKHAGSKPLENVDWQQVGRTAMKAGAITAVKVAHMPGPWGGEKATKVVTAAVGAALVDTFMSHKHPKTKGGVRHAAIRHAAEMALGGMVIGPARRNIGRKL